MNILREKWHSQKPNKLLCQCLIPSGTNLCLWTTITLLTGMMLDSTIDNKILTEECSCTTTWPLRIICKMIICIVLDTLMKILIMKCLTLTRLCISRIKEMVLSWPLVLLSALLLSLATQPWVLRCLKKITQSNTERNTVLQEQFNNSNNSQCPNTVAQHLRELEIQMWCTPIKVSKWLEMDSELILIAIRILFGESISRIYGCKSNCFQWIFVITLFKYKI